MNVCFRDFIQSFMNLFAVPGYSDCKLLNKIRVFTLSLLLLVFFLAKPVFAQTEKLVVDLPNAINSPLLFHPFFTSRDTYNDKIYKITENINAPTLISDSFQVLTSIKPILIDDDYYFIGRTEAQNTHSIWRLNRVSGALTQIFTDANILSVTSMHYLNGSLYLGVSYTGRGSSELLRFNLDTSVTTIIETIVGAAEVSSGIKEVTVFKDKIYFIGATDIQYFSKQLWRYDPETSDVTITMLTPGNHNIAVPIVFKNSLYFIGVGFPYSGSSAQELYRYDGSVIEHIEQINYSNAVIQKAFLTDTHIYYWANHSFMFLTDGTSEGTRQIDNVTYAQSGVSVGSSLYLIGDKFGSWCSLWRIEGGERYVLKEGGVLCNHAAYADQKQGIYYLLDYGVLHYTNPTTNRLSDYTPSAGITPVSMTENTRNYHFVRNGDLYKLDSSDLLQGIKRAYLNSQVIFAGEVESAGGITYEQLFNYDNVTASRRQLTANNHTSGAPSITPDGRRIVFSSLKNDDWDLWMASRENAPGQPTMQEPARITDTPSKFNEGWPVISPDGELLLHKLCIKAGGSTSWADPGVETRLVIRKLDGEVVSNNETSQPGFDPCEDDPNVVMCIASPYSHASWSPSGRQIIASAGNSLIEVDVADILSDGMQTSNLTFTSLDSSDFTRTVRFDQNTERDFDYPIYSNDGQHFFFTSDECNGGDDNRLGIYLMDRDLNTKEVACEIDINGDELGEADYRHLALTKSGRLLFSKGASKTASIRDIFQSLDPVTVHDRMQSNTQSALAVVRLSERDTKNNHPVAPQYFTYVNEPPHRPAIEISLPTGSKNAVLLTHGWRSKVDKWIVDTAQYQEGMADKICLSLGLAPRVFPIIYGTPEKYYGNEMRLHCSGNDWDVWVKDWRNDADTHLVYNEIGPIGAFGNAYEQGNRVGADLASKEYEHIHLYAHSAGSNLIDQAKNTIQTTLGNNAPTIHMTFFDAYDPTASLSPRLSLECVPDLILDGDPLGCSDQYSRYGNGADWVDNYTDTRELLGILGEIDATKLFMHSAYNISVSKWDKESKAFDPLGRHEWPISFYSKDTFQANSLSVPLGFGLSKMGATNYPENSFQAGVKCELPEYPGANIYPYCENVKPLKDESTIAEFSVSLDNQLVVFYSVSQSVTGIIELGTPVGAAKFVLTEIITGSPGWVEFEIETDIEYNAIDFKYDFTQDAEGLLKVYFDGQPISTVDQRLAGLGEQQAKRVFVGNKVGKHKLAFRLDTFDGNQANVKIIDVSLVKIDVFSAVDLDNDGIHNDDDLDDDGDGVLDTVDLFPKDGQEWSDNDSDGIGDNIDNDDDNDEWADGIDNCRVVFNPEQVDSNQDGVGDACDADSDGVADHEDAFPNDPSEWLDTDGDGVGNNADLDDDNDGMTDVYENTNGLNSLINDANLDLDNDGLTNLQEFQAGTKANDLDSDGDGIGDAFDIAQGVSSNLCSGVDAILASQVVLNAETLQCAAENSVAVESTVDINTGGRLEVISPVVSFKNGFSIPLGGELNVKSADPTPP